MSKKHIVMGMFALVLVLTGCRSKAATPPSPSMTPSPTARPEPTTPTDTPQPVPRSTPTIAKEGILISELLPGVPGNNNLEFIELYNAGSEAVDLDGWSLWYRMDDKQEAKLIHAWEDRTDVPSHGHYLLVRAEQDIGAIGDITYEVPLFERKGGLALRDRDGKAVDTLVWGNGPEDFASGSPALAPENGASLERLPGATNGNGLNSGDNEVDFDFNPSPNPQNSGAPLTPLPDQRLSIHLDAPEAVEPGGELTYAIEIQNLTGGPVQDVHAVIPVPAGFEITSLPSGASQLEDSIQWAVAELSAGATETGVITLQSPWTYLTTLVRGYYVEATGRELRAYGPPLPLSVEGGAVPIAVARTLEGQTVTVEGVATMYTGGFFAGSTGTKFYLEDDTGGIQVYCPGGQGLVEVSVGDRVRVTGGIEVYRDSFEIVPLTYPDDVQMLEHPEDEWTPQPITLRAAGSDESVPGRLVVVEGTSTRIQEFSYSYEIDLVDDQGFSLLVYIEKDTRISVEPLEVGESYRVTGISELYSGMWELKPRMQSDLAEIFPPELMLEMNAPNSALPGETITYTLIAYNHTETSLTNVRIVANEPTGGAVVTAVLDDGQREGASIVWSIPELAGMGESATVRYLATVNDQASGQVVVRGARVSADQWPELVETRSLLTFVGSSVPIWAIQGSEMESPYVRSQASTEGVVIGVFPALEGFWIQEPETDDDPATSAGLFVLTGELEIPVELGDWVQVHGKVREKSGQTMLHVLTLDDVKVLSSGNELPIAVELDPPQNEDEAQIYFEALEGMLVQVGEAAVAIAPTSKYGEAVLVRTHHGIERVMHGEPTGMMIFVDDGSNATHYDTSTLPFAIQSGDLVANVIGPLAYTFEKHKVEPIATPVITRADRPLPALEPTGPNEFSVVTFNVEDLFDFQDPHPSDPPKPSVAAYKLDLNKMASSILALGAPTIVGLQEIENIDILEDLAEQETIVEYGYEPILIEGTDSRGIDVGYLVRGDRATVQGASSYFAPEGLTSRPPLLITVTLHLEAGDESVYVLNNHFTSMSGGEQATEPRRTAQAGWNVTLLQRILAVEPEAQVVVLGDLNSFYDSPPLDRLRQAGLRHVYEFTAPYQPYSYIYQGESETLDHILLTPSLYAHLVRVEALHIDADYPPPIPGDESAQRVSDHDPVIAVFRFTP
jgi:predicted extracellular nuclease